MIREVDAAKKTIRIQAYSFTNENLGNALVAAKNRGVDIEVILDSENTGNPNSLMRLMIENNVPVYLDKTHAISHNKILIIDEKVVITGSANLTKAAQERNAENSLVIKDAGIATTYTANWIKHRSHSHTP